MDVGDPLASDAAIMHWAAKYGYRVFTHDLDFGSVARGLEQQESQRVSGTLGWRIAFTDREGRHLGIPGQGEKDSGANVKTIPG